MEAPSGGSPKPGPLDPDSLLYPHEILTIIIDLASFEAQLKKKDSRNNP
jgi:hypothetical protein